MIKRTTIEIDQDLLLRAKRTLGGATTRSVVEEALRRLAADEESAFNERTRRQLHDLKTMAETIDLDVLVSDEMWR